MRESPQSSLGEAQGAVTRHQRLIAESVSLRAKVKQQCEHLGWLIDSIRRQRKPDYYRTLQKAILVTHGCQAVHAASFAVRKVQDGLIVWDGTVEEFELLGCPQAAACYAWHFPLGNRRGNFLLLKSAQVDSPQRAVQLSLAAWVGHPCRELSERPPRRAGTASSGHEVSPA